MSLLDRWKILIGHITLLPVAGTAFAQANQLPLADASWEPRSD
ncbi:TPA: His-Xaa-Ser repeat protein HxsA, partial [Pseudomonas aeruginosa]|nr:His-Xaa-Ser repeat protein HxsA [Pseudomonas aeruginosa]